MANYKVGAARDLPLNNDLSWDGAAAEKSIWDDAGFDGDQPNPAKARKAFLLYDSENDELKGSYRFPFAQVIDGKLTAIGNGLRNAASRLPQSKGIPPDVLDRAQAVIDGYLKTDEGKSDDDLDAEPFPDYTARSKRPMEFRYVELRATDDGDEPGFDGYASTFWAVDSYGTAVAPGAFKRALKNRGDKPWPLLYQHSPPDNIGRASLKEDKTGLRATCSVCDDGGLGSVVMKRLRFGVPFGMSFGFNTLKDRTAADDDPLDFTQMPKFPRDEVRVLTELKPWEPSVVTFPANEAATIDAIRTHREQDALATLLEAVKTDRLTEMQRSLIDRLLTAWQALASEPPDASGASPRTATPATSRDWQSEFLILAAQGGYDVEFAQ